MRRIAWFCLLSLSLGCAAKPSMSRLQEENAQMAERIRQDQVRLMNLEEQNRQLHERLADAERAVATLHDATRSDTKLR